METKNLYLFIYLLFLTGMVLGVGILAVDKFGDAAADSTAVTLETVTISSGVGQLSLVDQGVTSVGALIYNASDYGDNHTMTTANWTSAGVISLGIGDGDYNLSYVYDANSTATDVNTDVTAALVPIASDWMPLIVTVGVLAIILGLVVSGFAMRRR